MIESFYGNSATRQVPTSACSYSACISVNVEWVLCQSFCLSLSSLHVSFFIMVTGRRWLPWLQGRHGHQRRQGKHVNHMWVSLSTSLVLIKMPFRWNKTSKIKVILTSVTKYFHFSKTSPKTWMSLTGGSKLLMGVSEWCACLSCNGLVTFRVRGLFPPGDSCDRLQRQPCQWLDISGGGSGAVNGEMSRMSK